MVFQLQKDQVGISRVKLLLGEQLLVQQYLNNTDPASSALLNSNLAAFTTYRNSTNDALVAMLVCIVSLIAFLILILVLISFHRLLI